MTENAYKLAARIVRGIGEPPDGYSWRVPCDGDDDWLLIKKKPEPITDILVWLHLDAREVLHFSYKTCFRTLSHSKRTEVHTEGDADECIRLYFFTRHIWSS
jgi:hypothetical protein